MRVLTVTHGEDKSVSFRTPPPFTRNPREFVYRWVAYLRNMVRTDVTAEWYGKPHARYYVIPKTAPPPEHGVLIYDRDGVAIYREALQPED